jgi:phosphoglycerate dehydrogenase-like enzyme
MSVTEAAHREGASTMQTILVAATRGDAAVAGSDDVLAHLHAAFPEAHIHHAHDLEGALAAPTPDALITFGYAWLADYVRERPELSWIHLLSAGADELLAMDLPFDRVRVSTSSGVHAATIAEYVIGGVLWHVKQFGRFAVHQRDRRWERARVDEIEGRTMAVIGLGAIGVGIAVRAQAFGMRVIGTKRSPEPLEGVDEVYAPERLHEVLAQADAVAVAVPLAPSTRGLIGAAEFAAMKPSAVFVNVARGAVVDEAALIDALREERIAGAVLDVFETEPLPEDSPLWGFDNVLITPHVSGSTPVYMRKAVDVFARNVRSLEATGELVTGVDPERGY